MPDLRPEQFSKYQASVIATPRDRSTPPALLVTALDMSGEYPSAVASLKIDRDTGPQEDQRFINDAGPGRGSAEHGHVQEESGQGRWTGGNFEAPLDKVSWLGSGDPHRHLLKSMMGLAMHENRGHGAIHADYALSEHGSAVSRGMAKRYGLLPHPANPKMEPTFTMGDFGEDSDLRSEMKSQARWNHANAAADAYGTSRRAQPDEMANAANMLESRRTKTTKIKPKQIPGQEQMF